MVTPNRFATLQGVIAPLLTPLADLDVLDCGGLERLIEHVIAGGIHGIFLLGTSGEGPSLSHALRAEVVRRACRQVEHRVPVLVGISDTSYVESLQLAATAAESGAGALVIAPPYYLRYAQADLLLYLERLCTELPLPLMLYNFPGLTKIPYSVETVKRAAEMPGIAGLKDSSGDMRYLKEILKVARHKEFSVFVGPEEHLLEAIRDGASGGVCGGANINPRVLTSLHDAARRGDWPCAEALQQKVTEMGRLLYSIGDPDTKYLRGVKCAASLLGLCSPVIEPPLQPFSDTEVKQIEAALKTLKLLA